MILTSVSYTHLDVYKRQTLDESNSKIPSEVDRLAKKDEVNLRKFADRANPTRVLSKEFNDYVQGIIDSMVNATGGYKTDPRTGITCLLYTSRCV